MSAAGTAAPAESAAGRRPVPSTAIEVRDLAKTFRIPHHQVNTLKERALHPLLRTTHEELRALRGISFDVGRGQFFGVVGRNGSGKSTLLKCMAGIYRPDGGRIRIAGRVAPFIELGVGFNPDLTARDNVLINAVMMGLSPREARERFDAIIDFAELRDFLDLKLKNYSSGMQVRLAFSTMVQSDSDVLLIDEVLAVGDAAFQQKCFDVFYELRDRGRTIVLVTHDMTAVERFCHRAMLLEEGRIELDGEPVEVGRRYLERNFARANEIAAAEAEAEAAGDGPPAGPPRGGRAEVVDAWVEDAAGERADAVRHGDDFFVNFLLRVNEDVDRARFDVWIDSEDATRVFGPDARARVFATSTMAWREGPRGVRAGERVRVRVRVRNAFVSGRFLIGCSVLAGSAGQDILVLDERAASFVTYGGDDVYGLARVDHELTLERDA